MKVLSLFSGGGLGDYGLELSGMTIVGQVEIESYCQKILKLRWPDVPKWTDIREVKTAELPKADIISGGFPCQPHSLAGKRKGKDDDRNLWPEMFRIIKAIRPRYILAENVPGVITTILDEILDDLESIGYETTPLVFPACAVGANHRRYRVWIVGHAGGIKSNGLPGIRPEKILPSRRTSQMDRNTDSRNWDERPVKGIQEKQNSKPAGICDDVPNTAQTISKRDRPIKKRKQTRLANGSWWSVEPRVGRVVNGMPNRMDRLKLLGNGQVVQCAEWLGKRIMEFDHASNS